MGETQIPEGLRESSSEVGLGPPHCPPLSTEDSCPKGWCGRLARAGESAGRHWEWELPPFCPQDPAVLPWISSCGTCPLHNTDAGVARPVALGPFSRFPPSHSRVTPKGGVETRDCCSPCRQLVLSALFLSSLE